MHRVMKVILAIDGSEHSQAALDAVASRRWPKKTRIEVVTVLHTKWPLASDPLFIVAAAHADSIREQERQVPEVLARAVDQLRDRQPGLAVTTKSFEGSPHEVIVQEAERWKADLVVLGSRGYGPIRRALLGSVAAAVAVEAPCAVEIIRANRPVVTAWGHTRVAHTLPAGKSAADISETGGQ